MRGIHRSPVDSPHKSQWHGAMMLSLICAWTNGSANDRERRRWFETPARSLWRHCNEMRVIEHDTYICLWYVDITYRHWCVKPGVCLFVCFFLSNECYYNINFQFRWARLYMLKHEIFELKSCCNWFCSYLTFNVTPTLQTTFANTISWRVQWTMNYFCSMEWHNLNTWSLNLSAPGRSERDSKNVIFNLILLISIFRSSHDNALRWMPQDLTDDKSTLVQVMAWCRRATSHYLSQCWRSSLSPYGVARPQWVNHYNNVNGYMRVTCGPFY